MMNIWTYQLGDKNDIFLEQKLVKKNSEKSRAVNYNSQILANKGLK